MSDASKPPAGESKGQRQKARAGKNPPDAKKPTSEPPPSSRLSALHDKPGAAWPYIAGVIVMGGLIAFLVSRQRAVEEPAPAPSKPAPVATASASAKPQLTLPDIAPPAPPPEEPTAQPTASAVGSAAPHSGGGHPAACDGCGAGQGNAALDGAVRGRAGTAQGCYNRALREGGSEGSLMVSVSVGSDGSVCGASIVSDTLHNPAISSCVLAKMSGSGYPRPEQGCVTRQVPIVFKVR